MANIIKIIGALLLCSCTVYEIGGSSSSAGVSSSSAASTRWCIYGEAGDCECILTNEKKCPLGGEYSDICPSKCSKSE